MAQVHRALLKGTSDTRSLSRAHRLQRTSASERSSVTRIPVVNGAEVSGSSNQERSAFRESAAQFAAGSLPGIPAITNTSLFRKDRFWARGVVARVASGSGRSRCEASVANAPSASSRLALSSPKAA
jgi:hypothetical protein